MPTTEGRKWYGQSIYHARNGGKKADELDLEGHTDDAVFGGVSRVLTSLESP
jgi:hypothetical protein